MRKRWLMIVPTVLTLLLISSITSADHSIKTLFHESEIPLDVSPQVVNGKIMAPVKAIAEALGFDAKWDSKKSEVIITEKVPLSILVATLPEADASLYASESKGYY
ncbi:copper amine oxidase N-terminal domain-containing protein [Paenibacillus dokdonensis]|uniref:copper amine oxidase N-terminal domain-containing protein n=1 Tax=Paenibacillus dokdonensis TaxID=2567944 RepID=UPI0010A83704|nr:copper amine oxidase N-terminal domain-containing protein [Paenibacillus dokdonensis]